MATTATVRSNRKQSQNSNQTSAKDSPSTASRQRSRPHQAAGEKVITFAVIVIGSGILGISIGGGLGALIGVAAGIILGWTFTRKR